MLKRILLTGACAAFAAGLFPLSGSIPEAAAQQQLRLGTVELAPSRGNPYGGSGTPGIFVWSMLYDGLTFVDTKGVPGPALATSWRNIDPSTWQFKLRPNVKFDNGEAMTPQAFITTVEWLQSDQGKTQVVAREVTNFGAMRVVDDMTIELKTKAPDAILPSRVSTLYIVAPKAWKDMGLEGYANKPVGTGSFKVESWAAEKVLLNARTDSWRNPEIRRVEATSLPERPARTQALLSGQLDITIGMDTAESLNLYGIAPNVISSIETSEGLLARIQERYPVKGKNILFPRSDLPNPTLKRGLMRLGAQVSELTVYENRKPAKRELPKEGIGCVLFTSPSTVKNFLADYGTIPPSWQILSKGPHTQAALKDFGYESEIIIHE